MPIFRNTASDGVAFTGADGDTGLWEDPEAGVKVKPEVRTLTFYTAGAAVDFEVRMVDPVDPSNRPLIRAATGQSYIFRNFGILPVEEDGTRWGLVFTSTAMAGAPGTLVIDHGREARES